MISTLNSAILFNFMFFIIADENVSTNRNASSSHNITESFDISPTPTSYQESGLANNAQRQVIHTESNSKQLAAMASPSTTRAVLLETLSTQSPTVVPESFILTAVLRTISLSSVAVHKDQAVNNNSLPRETVGDVFINGIYPTHYSNNYSVSMSVSKYSNSSLTSGDKKSSCADNKKSCRSSDYVPIWVGFYIRVGGWLMLSIVLFGIIALVVTHVLGKRQLRRRSFYTRRKESGLRLSRLSEARDKLISHLV